LRDDGASKIGKRWSGENSPLQPIVLGKTILTAMGVAMDFQLALGSRRLLRDNRPVS
jgi:hypothetical protein